MGLFFVNLVTDILPFLLNAAGIYARSESLYFPFWLCLDNRSFLVRNNGRVHSVDFRHPITWAKNSLQNLSSYLVLSLPLNHFLSSLLSNYSEAISPWTFLFNTYSAVSTSCWDDGYTYFSYITHFKASWLVVNMKWPQLNSRELGCRPFLSCHQLSLLILLTHWILCCPSGHALWMALENSEISKTGNPEGNDTFSSSWERNECG